MDCSNRVAQVQRDAIIVKALFNVARKSAGVWLDLEHGLYMGAFQGQPPGHDHSDIAGPQNHHFPGRHGVIKVNVRLGNTCREHTGGTFSGNPKRPPGPLPAAHGKDDGFGLPLP